MGVTDTLVKEIKGISILVIIIVVFSIVLLKFKSVPGGACAGSFPNYNITSDLCYNSTGGTQALTTTGASINSAVGYLDDPITWISIIIIIIVVAWLMKYLKQKNTM